MRLSGLGARSTRHPCPPPANTLQSPPRAPRPPAYRAIACGADVNHSYSSQPAAQLVWEANLQCGGGADQPLSPTNLGHISVLHAACRVGGSAHPAVLLCAWVLAWLSLCKFADLPFGHQAWRGAGCQGAWQRGGGRRQGEGDAEGEPDVPVESFFQRAGRPARWLHLATCHALLGWTCVAGWEAVRLVHAARRRRMEQLCERAPAIAGHQPALFLGPPPFPAAAQAGDLLMTELLLQSGAQIDAVEVMRRTPLMYCLLYDQAEAAKLLLRWAPAPACLGCRRRGVGARYLPPRTRWIWALRPALAEATGHWCAGEMCHFPPADSTRPCTPHRACRRGAACTRDRHGLTAAQLAQGRPCSGDGELVALLSRQP